MNSTILNSQLEHQFVWASPISIYPMCVWYSVKIKEGKIIYLLPISVLNVQIAHLF